MDNRFTTAGERGTATRLVRAALNAGYTISVYDGEEYAVKRGRSEAAILPSLASTEADTLVIRDSAGECVGELCLIWGNDPDGSELIADHTDNAAMQALYDAAQR